MRHREESVLTDNAKENKDSPSFLRIGMGVAERERRASENCPECPRSWALEGLSVNQRLKYFVVNLGVENVRKVRLVISKSPFQK